MNRLASAGLLSGLIIVVLLLLSGCGSPGTPTIAVGLTPGSTQSIDQAQTVSITDTVKQDPKTAGVTWAVSGGGTLANPTTTSATYNAPASVTTAFTATVTATSVSDATKMATLQIKVAPLPVITTTSFAATVGTAYNGTLSESGGTSPYRFTITSRSLPAGLTLNSSTGAITGMPTGPAGNSSVTFQITDAAKMSASHAVAITVNAPPALTIATASLPAGTTGAAYSQTLQASGGVPSYTWAVTTGSLPAGLSLNSRTGAISGTPSGTFTGTTNFTVTATDSQTPTHATSSANLSITVSAPPLSVTTTSLAGGTIGNAYANQTLHATGGISPYKWSVTAGSLPAGLSLNALTGVISGTPTGTFVGSANFTVTAADSEAPTAKMASANLTIAISVAPLSVTTTSSSLAVGVVSSAYAGATLRATGGITPYSWAITTGSLPAGLTLSAAGAISGTPTASGTSNFTVTVADSETPTAKTATANLSIVVNSALSATTASLPAGVIGTNYSQTLAAAGGINPYTWSITTGSLPTGLSLNASTGVISGKPSGTFTGTVNFTVTVTDNESPTKQSASANLSIVINAPPLSVTTSSLAGGSIGNAYSKTLQATGGITPYSWAVTTGSLPAGLILNASTGVISGTPAGTFVGTDSFTVTVTDAETPTGGKASANLSIAISVAPLSVTTTSSSLPLGVVSSVYAGATLQATGGITPYSWAVTTGSLPAGLILNASTGAISGTPAASGTANFTVTVTDSETPTAKTATANLSIVVNSALSVTTTALPAGVIGTVYPGATLAAAGGITPYTWSITTGSLPAGLSLNASTGAISGTPTGTFTGAVNFTVTVTDNESPTKQTASANLSIIISASPLKVTTTSLAGGSVGTGYTNQTLQATGGITPYSWSVTTGSLPAGLSLNATTGVISGTPTGTFVGTDNFTVTVTDSETPTGKTASANLSITISVAPLSVTTTSSSLAVGVVNSVYPGATLQATGGITPYSWAVTTGSLPAGLILNASTGAISGTPAASGSVNFTVTVTDSETPTAKTATANLSIVVNPALSVTTNSLAAGVIGTPYSQTLTAAGGITPYTWSATSLPAGLSLNTSTGVISGTPSGTFTGTVSVNVTVTDNESPTKHSAAVTLTITISAPTLKVTTTSLPTGVLNNSYSATVNATGGIQPYIWGLSGNPAWLSINSSTGVLSGTPTATGTVSFTVTVTDSATPTAQTASANLSISVNNNAPLTITTTGLPAGVVNTAYQNAMLQASGGVQPYTWSISAGSLPANLTLNASTGAITGTPTATGTTNFTVKVTDSTQPTPLAQTANLSITINSALTITTTSVPNGSVGNQYNATVNAAGGLQPYSWSITSGSLPPGLNFNNNNTLSISGQPTTTGTYTFTLQVTDSENAPVSVSNSYTIVIGTQPPGYTVSGNVGYSGSKTGWTYLQLNTNNCVGCGNNLGTSISEAALTSGGAFTIHGVQPGTYTLQAFMDNLGYGAENASNPTGSVANLTVTNSGVNGVSIVLIDPGTVTLSSAPSWGANKGNGAFNGGALVSFQTIKNSNGIEMPASYTVQWSTSSSFGTVLGSKSVPATGGNNPWIVNGLTNGQTLFFRAQGVAGSSTSNWSGPSSAMTIGAPTGGNTVSGTVTFSEAATGPLYVGFYNQSTGAVYADVVGSKTSPPHSPAAYTVQIPTGSGYYLFGSLDQNNSGLLTGPGQVSNTNNGNNSPPISITGNMSNENLTLPSGNSTATVATQVWEQINSNGTNTYYNIGFNINGVVKLPVAVELATGPTPGVVIPADIANGAFGGSSDQFSYWANLNGVTPHVGDTYTLNVTYSDGTSEVLTVTISTVLNAFATNLAPQGSGVSTTPNFNWTDPQNASSYTYQFQLWDQNGNQIWQIPGNNSNSNGFSSSITSITWGVDPTNSGNLPSVSSLNGSSNYNWQITAKDNNGNSAGVQVTFQTAAAPLTLPASGSIGSTVVGQNWGGAVNASGGVGPNYTFTVNGTPVPTDGTQVSLGDNLVAWNTGGNTLSLGGTPTSIATVSFTVSVTDSASNTAGPDTYTITVSAASPLSSQTTTLPGGDKGWLYNASLQANGGVQPYTWSITSGTPPGGLSINNSNGNGSISGTPTAAGTSTFTIMVTDSASATASASVSIAIGDCANNATLHGNYAFLVNGWKGSATDATSSAGSFVADGAGTISSGSLDNSDQTSGPATGTFTGTYCVNSDNLALLTITISPGSTTTTLAAALDSSDGNGHIISYDPNNSAVVSGLLRKQTTTAFATSKINGNYAFGFVGADQQSNRFGMAGEFNSNGSGTLTGTADYDDSGNVGQTNLTASDFSVVSSTTGRGTVSIFVSAPAVTLNFVFYVVSSSEVLMMAADNTESPSMILASQVLQQSGTFTDASLNGISVIELQGVGGGGGSPEATAGFFTTNGAGTFSISADQNQGGTMGTTCGSGTYSVSSNGRMTLTSLTQCGGGGGGGHNPIFYLVAKNQAFVVGTDSSVTLGTMTPQVGSGFTVASLSGSYLGGGQQTVDYTGKTEVTQIHADGAGNLMGTSDQNSQNGCGGSCAGPDSSTIVATYALYPGGPDGKFAITQGGVTQVYLYMISTTQAVILPVSSSQNQSSKPSLTDFHQ